MSLDHPFIVKFIDNFFNEKGNMCSVLNLYTLGDLQQLINQKKERNETFTEEEIKRYVSCMILSVYYLNHQQQIYHRDLKPSNFLVYEKDGKKYLHLNDFGIAKNAKDNDRLQTSLERNVGTPLFMAPEYLKRDTSQKFLQFDKHDIWAIGVITYNLLTLKLPFNGINGRETEINIMTKDPEPIDSKYD